MKKQIIAVIGVIACVALCASVWARSTEVGDLPAGPVKTAVTAEIEARSKEVPHIFISEVTPAPEVEVVAENELEITTEPIAESEPKEAEVTAEKEIEKPEPPTSPTAHAVSKSAPAPTEPKPGDRTVIDGESHVWIPGFGWIKDEGGGSVGTMVGNPGDQLTGNKVGRWEAMNARQVRHPLLPQSRRLPATSYTLRYSRRLQRVAPRLRLSQTESHITRNGFKGSILDLTERVCSLFLFENTGD